MHVRLIVDDLLTIGQDQLISELDRRPNIEVRLFNPWKDRSTLSRGGEMIAEMERLNTRMHDKLLIADGRAAVVGGRNIGDHYFGLSHDYNFHDLDLQAKNRAAEELKPVGVEVSDWQELASQLAEKLHVGKSLLVYDETVHKQPARDGTQRVMDKIFKVIPKEQY